jgi:4a-hydroxytetrahydrobiopterin dehydratase
VVDLLTEAERAARLPALGETGWGAVEGRDAIRKILKFRNFSEAWAFMNRVALLAEKMNHHPEWRNTYNVVDVTLSTHDCHGLSVLDVDMAAKIDSFAAGATVQTDHSLPVLSLCQIRSGLSGR